MVKKRKKRLRIKWKNFIIFIMIVIISLTLLIKGTSIIITTINNSFKDKTVKKEKSKKKLSNKEKKYKYLDNINTKIKYFREENIDRYIDYKKNNPNLETEKVIIDVNIGLDKEPYKDAEKAKNLNTNIILVNKYNYLEEDYIPNNLEKINKTYALSNMKLVKRAKEAYEEMAKDAEKKKLKLVVMSSYRNYDYQVDLYNRYAKKDGKDEADTYSGRPGYSEHQTGLAIDIYNGKTVYTKFESTKEFNWMQENAHKYGFILRFPKDKEKETGYIYEAWHYRYVGKEIAKKIKENNICLEEYLATKK